MKRSNKLSVLLSMVFAALFACLLIGVAIILPVLVESLIKAPDLIGDRSDLPQSVHVLLLVVSYLAIAVALSAVVLLFALLRYVRTERVFTDGAVRVLSAISWCCFGEGILFFAVGIWFQLAFLICAAACFLGLCLRVVGNVIAEAMRYKQENDLTV